MGNIFLGIQPARPPLGEADLASASHDKTKPPHHQYLAFYHWLQEIWKADIVVHVGTHGLAEFTKGKEVGLSNECFPDRLISSMPHLYFYHVVNTSEVVIAKRRLYATTLGYNSPPFTTSDLYEGYAELEDLIDEYSQSRQHGDLKADIVQEKIFKKAGELKIEGRDVPGIHDELYEMKRRIIPKGLHILGEIYERKDMQSFFEFILRYDREGIKSLNRILAESKGLDYDQVLHNRESFVEVLKEIDRIASHLCGLCLEKSVDFAVMESGISSKAREELRETLSFGLDFLEKYSSNDAEITGLIRGLEAGFIEQSAGGDVIRTPDILPTGRNLTQFDPNRIPTQTAMQRGQEIAENTICVYKEKKANYPETVGVILWGFETTKTGGESIGQILSYLGVRIIRDAGSWAPRLEVISLEELGRPRVDCLVNICGFFRDMFPNIVLLLDRAFNLVAELDEDTEKNFVRKHSLKNKEDLKSANLDERTALKMANGRVFGPKAGEYGTRMLPLLEDSIWKTEEELAEVFIQSMDHLYTENLHAVKSDELYRANLSRVELVSQVRDTHDREIIDLDHYYEFFGGLSRAVQMEKGEPVRMLISDTTEEVICTEDVARAINRGARTRLLNPRWANAMLSHEFHGAQQIADRVENMLGLAATTHSVDNWIWSAIAERYLFDREMNEKLTNNNSFAAAAVAERLLEAEKRGYWQATTEEMEKLRAVYLDMEGDIEEGLNRE
jgi:cobaltochelatase CobN